VITIALLDSWALALAVVLLILSMVASGMTLTRIQAAEERLEEQEERLHRLERSPDLSGRF